MCSKPFASVVVPTRDRPSLLRDTLASLAVQDYPQDRFEIVVVDDGSTSLSTEEVAREAAEFESVAVRYVRLPPSGLNTARNAGISTARGELICFVDDDIEAPSTWLGALIEGAARHADAGCFGGPIRLRIEGKMPKICGREALGETELDLGPEEQRADAVWGANMVVTRAALKAVGRFNENLSGGGDEEEWERRYITLGGVIWYLPEGWLWHRRRAEDVRLSRLLRKRFIQGRTHVKHHAILGATLPVRFAYSAIPRFLGHAIRRHCAWGLLSTATRLGMLWELAVRQGPSQRDGPREWPPNKSGQRPAEEHQDGLESHWRERDQRPCSKERGQGVGQ